MRLTSEKNRTLDPRSLPKPASVDDNAYRRTIQTATNKTIGVVLQSSIINQTINLSIFSPSINQVVVMTKPSDLFSDETRRSSWWEPKWRSGGGDNRMMNLCENAKMKYRITKHARQRTQRRWLSDPTLSKPRGATIVFLLGPRTMVDPNECSMHLTPKTVFGNKNWTHNLLRLL